ncbi:MAG: triacylglycerol lipase [Solirubrobacteraceae bacterium]|jgi:pimeloyl-ACP methyl ester carboxylesterase|nr:triacylglycerol lipase [Solirubrobacteraceae bacterium]
MLSQPAPREAQALPLRGELRYGFELARLLVDREFLRPSRQEADPAVLLVPGFMAGDQSLRVLAGWLRRRGSITAGAGMLVNADCAERAVRGIETRLQQLAERAGARVALIGQSRGGALARVAALRNPDLVSTLVMLGSPVLAPLDVGPAVLGAVRSVAWLGDLGVPGTLSSECRDGPCCAAFREDLQAPLAPGVRAVAIYSRSDGIVSWKACLDPYAEHLEVSSSHGGMSVNADVYRALARILDGEADPWTG